MPNTVMTMQHTFYYKNTNRNIILNQINGKQKKIHLSSSKKSVYRHWQLTGYDNTNKHVGVPYIVFDK